MKEWSNVYGMKYAKENISKIARDVYTTGEPVMLVHRGRPYVGIVRIEEYAPLDKNDDIKNSDITEVQDNE